MSLRPNSRIEVRSSSYKVGVDAEEARRKREDNLMEIRKNKREDNLKKRRQETESQQVQLDLDNKLETAMVTRVFSDDPNLQLESTTQFRKLLSIESYSLVEELVNANVIPRFVEFLTRHNFPQLQLEAAWSLTNIASGTSDHTKIVVDHGAVPHLVQLLSCPSEDIREQAVWALGNIAGDNPNFRDLVLCHGALMILVAQLNEHSRLSMLRNATFALSTFFSGKPSAPFEQTKPALPVLQHLIQSDDEQILTNTCWALYYLSDGTNDNIQAVIEAGVCRRLVELLIHPSSSVLMSALRTVGNIVTGDFLQTQAVIEANIIPPLMHLLQTAEFDIRKEAAWAISNATLFASNEQIKCLVKEGCIKPLCDLLDCKDPKIVTHCLEGLENILEVGEAERQLGDTADMNLYCQYIDDAGGLEKIENLQSNSNNEINAKAEEILETYWQESDENDENIPPDDVNGEPDFNFNFGTNQYQFPPDDFTFG